MTIEAAIKKDKINSKGECPIAIRIYANGKILYHSLGIRIPPENFSNGRVVAHKLAANYNAVIDKKLLELRRVALRLSEQNGKATIDDITTHLKPRSGLGGDLLAFYSKVAVNKPNAGTRRRYGCDYSVLCDYANGKLTFGEVTPAWLTKFQAWLLKTRKWETMRNAMKSLRHVFNEAIKAELVNYNPFADWKYPAASPPNKTVYLTPVQVKALRDYLHGTCPVQYKPILAWFLVECHCGIRFSDWGKQRIEKNGSKVDMILRTTKTGTDIRLPVDAMPELNEMLNYIEANGYAANFTLEHANRILKIIGPMVGITVPLTTHVGRHTAASNLMNMDGLSERTIAEVLGISVKVLVSTYAHFSADKIRREFERVRG